MNAVNYARFRFWSQFWGGGLAWLLHFLTIWVAAEFGCLSALSRPGPAGVSLVAWVVLGLSAFFIGIALWGLLTSPARMVALDTVETDLFVRRFARVANVIFLLVIVAQTVPAFFYLKDCGSAIE